MFDGSLVDLTFGRSEQPRTTGRLPWQYVAMLLCLAVLSVVAAILYPDVFGAPPEQF